MERHPRLVVTGGQGQLGRALQSLVPHATFVDRDEVDLAHPGEARALLADLRPELIIHGGAYTAVDAAEADPGAAWAVNAEGTRAVVDAAAAAGAAVVYISTDYVFSGERATPYPEDHATGPVSVYGKSKLAGEEAVATLPRHLIVRTSWVFGDGHNFIRSILTAARSGRAELTVVNDQRGRPTYAPDLATGIVGLLACQAQGTFHLQGGGEPATWAEVAEAALASAGLATTVRGIATSHYNAGRPGPIAERPAYSVLDCAKAAALGVALRPWRQAVDEYVTAECVRVGA